MKVFIKKFLLTVLCVLTFYFFLAVFVYSAELNEIVLDDGSIIQAEVVSMTDGKYSLRSQSMGDFTIDAARVSQISKGGVNEVKVSEMAVHNISAEPAAVSSDALKTKVANVQADIMKDPQAMQMVTSMASDPAITQLLDDPEIAAASKAGDIGALMRNPKFLAVMQDSRIQGMASKMMDKNKE